MGKTMKCSKPAAIDCVQDVPQPASPYPGSEFRKPLDLRAGRETARWPGWSAAQFSYAATAALHSDPDVAHRSARTDAVDDTAPLRLQAVSSGSSDA